MDVLVKGIEFEDLNHTKVMRFLAENKKTQVVNGTCFFGKKHVIHSVLQTLKAFRNGSNIAKTEELEFLLRFSSNRQINKALEKCKPAKRSIFISWAKNKEEVFSAFKKEFKPRMYNLKEPDEEAQKEAIEKTATFYLSS